MILSKSQLSLAGLFALILIFVSTPFQLQAQSNSNSNTNSKFNVSSDIDAETIDRVDRNSSVRLITNRDESVDLAVTNSGIAIQFSDKFLENLDNEINSSENDSGEKSAFGDAIRSMVSSGVRSLLEHAILIPYYEIGSVSYSDGRIIITDLDGKEIFNDLEMNDKQVMDDFSRRDARRFVADAERMLI